MHAVQVVSNLAGMLMSGLAIWTTSVYQIWAGSKQKEYQVCPPHFLVQLASHLHTATAIRSITAAS